MKKTTFADGALICSYNTLHVPVRGCSFHLSLLFQNCVFPQKIILMLTKIPVQAASIEIDSSSPTIAH